MTRRSPASPIRAHAYYDRETHLLSVERPVGDRSWSHVLNALLHQLIPDAAGSEVPKLTLSLRPLMALSPEEGHRELSDAGVPELGGHRHLPGGRGHAVS